MRQSVGADDAVGLFPVFTGTASFAATRNCCFADNFAQHIVGADDADGPIVRIHRNCLFCTDTATVASQTYFFCCARKSRQKDAQETRHIAR